MLRWKPLVFMFPLLFVFVPSACGYEFRMKSYFRYKLDNYDTWIQFSNDLLFDKMVWYADKIWLYNASMDGSCSTSEIWLSIENANMTVTNFFSNNKLEFTLVGNTYATSTAKIYIPNRDCPKVVAGATAWSYNSITKLVTITKLHSSLASVTLDWAPYGSTPTPTKLVETVENIIPILLSFILTNLLPIVISLFGVIVVWFGNEEERKSITAIGFVLLAIALFLFLFALYS